MGDTKIEWTEKTWNPVRGCTRVSEGCRNCYAERVAARFAGPGLPYEGLASGVGAASRWTGKLAFSETALLEPLKRRKPTTYFVNSMSDLFHEKMPEAWIDRVFAVMALCPQHTFQVLTKRPERMRAYLTRPAGGGKQDLRNHLAWTACLDVMHLWAPGWKDEPVDGKHRRRAIQACVDAWPLPNVWLGTSCEDQPTADARVLDLLETPAAVRFVSAEPLLGPIVFDVFPRQPSPTDRTLSGWEGVDALWMDALTGQRGILMKDGDVFEAPDDFGSKLDWIIVGGESGPNARPMHPDWARSIRDQCAEAGVAFHFKQRGAWSWLRDSDGEWPTDAESFIRMRSDGTRGPDGWPFQRVGKKSAGRLLDDVEHNGMPGAEGAHA